MGAVNRRVYIRHLGLVDYQESLRAMQDFTSRRTPDTEDEIWLLQHPPVYTLGLKKRNAQCSDLQGVPVVHSDRGGDISYHGPGQLIAYVLMDLRRRSWGVKTLVGALEQSVIDLLSMHDIGAQRRPGAPGVYVGDKKIAALGLRVRQGGSYHGLSLNVDMDLTPYTRIDPCGYPGLSVTQLVDLGIGADMEWLSEALIRQLTHQLGYNSSLCLANLDHSASRAGNYD
ncbi:MAG: lipoyl(octanoyl) transferase LipB [Gammaproteobacteria bacterium]|nr:MAG: lipoyl(octanoyl) transferase LipB [Gammaproteobacteria bacterium]